MFKNPNVLGLRRGVQMSRSLWRRPALPPRPWDPKMLPPAGKRTPAEKHNTLKGTNISPTAKRKNQQETPSSQREQEKLKIKTRCV